MNSITYLHGQYITDDSEDECKNQPNQQLLQRKTNQVN